MTQQESPEPATSDEPGTLCGACRWQTSSTVTAVSMTNKPAESTL